MFRASLEEHHRRGYRAGIMRGLLGFAALAAAPGLPEAGALLYGFAHRKDKVIGLESGEKADERDDEHFAARVRDRLTHQELEAAQSKWRHLTLEGAVTFALNLPVMSQITKKPSHDLTRRELEVLILIAKGLANGEIAGHLELSKRTVEKHIANILSKLDLKNTAQLVRWAMDQEIVSTSSNQ